MRLKYIFQSMHPSSITAYPAGRPLTTTTDTHIPATQMMHEVLRLKFRKEP